MVRVDGPIGRATQRVAGSRAFTRFGPSVVPRLDRLVHRLTGGKRLLGGALVPSLMLTTTGAKTGQPREVPVACVPDGDVIYLAGSNFGREQHPAWSGNLIKTPRARISLDGVESDVVAHLLSDEEKAEVWPKLLKVWPTYDRYVERSGRNLRVFRLERVSGGG